MRQKKGSSATREGRGRLKQKKKRKDEEERDFPRKQPQRGRKNSRGPAHLLGKKGRGKKKKRALAKGEGGVVSFSSLDGLKELRKKKKGEKSVSKQ